MSHSSSLELYTAGRNGTIKIGEAIGKVSVPGTVIGLTGDLGAGKTVMVKGMASALGAKPEQVVSPTFTLVNEYKGRVPLYHFDLYRMGDELELDSIDYRKYLDGGVCAVEWFERFPHAWPDDSLKVEMEYLSPRKRRISISGPSELIARIKTILERSLPKK